MKLILSCLFVCLSFTIGKAQLTGSIRSTEGDTLSFASIYIKGTSTGTTSNLEGNYILTLEPGTYEIVFQYVGYQSQIKTIVFGGEPQVLDVDLSLDVFELNTISISADAEDPAYQIIRNAIQKRKYYKNLVDRFSVDVYVKGNQKILSMPEKILGQSTADLDGMLDSTRTGIVYLSETLSQYHYQSPNDYKEVIVSSKVSGDDNGYSFNSAKEMEFNIYENTLAINREIVSPIANNAMSYYEYKLEGTKYDQNKRLINKIKVIPKRDTDPCFQGTIYIIEDLWNVHSLNLHLSKKAVQLAFIDSLNLNQVFIPVEDPDLFRLFSNSISFGIKLFGVELEGQFSAFYSDYNLEPNFDKNFFSNEVYKVEKESNTRNTVYWDSIRPVPLTIEEFDDYIKKDSIQIVRKSPAYLDSIDREANKFEVTDLLFGYNFQNSQKKVNFGFGSVLSNVGFNTVQGYRLGPNVSFRKYYNETETKRLRIKADVDYGFSEKIWRANLESDFLFNHVSFSRIRLNLGKKINQFNESPAISKLYNEIYSLFFRRNYAKFYEKTFIEIIREHEIVNGIYYKIGLEYASRNALNNQSSQSFFYEDSRLYTSNNPISPFDFGETLFPEHQSFLLDMDIRFNINQKYFSYPDRKFIEESAWPTFWLHLKKGIKALGGDTDFTHVAASIKKRYSLGVKGDFEFMINGGMFFGDDFYFVDAKHFNGTQILLSTPEKYFKTFLLLPYYQNSSRSDYVQFHAQHHFNGYILDKFPLIRKLGWQLVAGGKYLHTDEIDYSELHLGIENMGFGIFKLLRMDFVWGFSQNTNSEFGVRLGIGFDN